MVSVITTIKKRDREIKMDVYTGILAYSYYFENLGNIDLRWLLQLIEERSIKRGLSDWRRLQN